MADTIEFGNLSIEIKQTGTEVTYRFVGDVDERFRQKDVPRIKKANVTFALEEVNNFNSCGIREWIYLIRDIGELGSLKFTRCSVTMIDQINMVPDSLGKGRVESFFAPYYCECSGEVNRLIKVDEHLESLKAHQAPEFSCEKCSKPLSFDALEEAYFMFADAHGTPQKTMPKAG
jgi:hypothetical protein